MTLKKFFVFISIATMTCLIYIQMHVNIYSLAYEGKQKEKEIFKLVDTNSYVVYHIAKLKSAHHLGFELLTDQSDIIFSGNDQIVRIEVPGSSSGETLASSSRSHRGPINFLAGIFSLRAEAEAHPIR